MANFLIWVLILIYLVQVISFFRAAKQFKRMSRLFKQAMDDHAILSAAPELPDQEV